ncbi:MAG: UDP-N-acetylglucosamine 2-epimerase [Candidatus Marinimicrobia bacterium]|nr:UDP-N-acetylglucosamine 2-epimerase [Candidatus Neomarinimicrobiota bacterium]
MAEETSFQQKSVHTGQRYDIHMSDIFFTELGLHEPDYYLGVGSSSHARQTAATMVAFEEVINEFRSDIVLSMVM